MGITLHGTFAAIADEYRRNRFIKTRCIVLLFRIAHYLACRSIATRIAGAPVIALYIVLCDWLMGVEIPVTTRIGKGLTLFHGTGLVVNGFCVIGKRCVLRHGVTIGNTMLADGSSSGVPTVGDDVEFGANSIALGDIRIGDRARIGAGAVVVRDVPEGGVAVGVPARVILKEAQS
ncbi:colanic acid biosynthesis acetyltransferase [Burkholderia stagnalis]|uniref:serine O-acetyltransferase n=1 Tax=Burkholderia stagnalis TaxID=1503054 RepID=UPI0007530924|nr:DapH/DapD/GlmU-related protein [Burkholderia stagnalis]KVD93277.1 colanic acid biosynthesis acetyltransferase [Burkholderia stagnalis]KVO52814.1 colanic acid biosynthesis acetyltransferase [Burkholderia stagnalis]KVP06893.1 colanic acid biosynthesis acetyltransferase [Burkholderia stagnalis]KVW97682.1 colanic acid biosynthesis acetyltransferase [Burkholderia stagnalis]KWH83349.1 colanic acid biosynthesis acetyltransferase [Burkholderia stagnalis]